MEVLTSAQNPKVKAWASLKERKYRKKYRQYIVEGVRNLEVYLMENTPLDAVLVDPFSTNDRLEELVELAQTAGVPVYELEAHLLRHITDTEHPQGIAAIAKIPDVVGDLEPFTVPGQCKDVLVVADQISDPGNLGTLIRSADAVGAKAVIVLQGSADPYQPKTVRAAMGSLARIPVLEMDQSSVIPALSNLGYHLIGAEANQGVVLYEANLSRPIALFIGHETGGLSSEIRDSMEEFVALPMPGGVESLNAGVAASVLLYEALRRRYELGLH